MKKIYYVIFTIVLLGAMAGEASAQYLRSSYFMRGSTERSKFNPAFTPYRGYITVPVLGGLQVDYKSNSLGMREILYPGRGMDGKMATLFHRNVRPDEILPKLRNVNAVETNISMPLLGFGMNMFEGKGFLTFEVGTRFDVGVKLPYELFELIKLGSGVDGAQYDIGALSASASAYSVASIGYAHHLPEYNLSVGGRINLLFGLARVNMYFNKMQMEFSHDQWSIDAIGGIDIAANGSSLRMKDDGYVDINKTFQKAFSNIKGIAGLGMTFDLGAEYKIMDLVTVSASVLDLGYMRWGSQNVQSALSESNYSFSGFRIVDGEDVGTSDWSDFKDFLKFTPTTNRDAIRPSLRATFVLGANMDIPYVEEYFNFGLMFMDRKTEFLNRSELTAILTTTPLDWLSASLSYTVGKQSNIGRNFANTLGFSFNIHTRGINLLAGTDYIVTKMSTQGIPAVQKAFNVYFGISVPFGPKRTNQLK